MQIVGLIGGISWVSTVEYYRLINQLVNQHLGGLNSSQCIIHSLNYEEIKNNNEANDWEKTFNMLSIACNGLKNSGAKAIVLCANTMHLLADRLQQEVGLPVIHIAVATAKEIEKHQIKKVGLLGTRFTMELDFFKDKLKERGIDSIIPATSDRAFVHQSIFDELGKGIINESTRQRYKSIIDSLVLEGAEGIILGCTEIPLLIQQSDVTVPVFDTTLLHSKAIVDFQLT